MLHPVERRSLMVVRHAPGQHNAGMAEVISFVARTRAEPATDAASVARTTASVVADLVSVVEQVKAISGRVLPLPSEPQEVERTLQALLDAISALEHATDVLTHHGERTPF
jgi:hypothetical protein